MGRYILKKIQHSFWTLLGVVTTIFFLFNVLPGDPAQMMLGQNEDQAQLAIVKQKYGFDQPVLTQYLYYLNDLSPLSFHSIPAEDYTFLESHPYSFQPLFKTTNTTLVLKYPIPSNVLYEARERSQSNIKRNPSKHHYFGGRIYLCRIDFRAIFRGDFCIV